MDNRIIEKIFKKTAKGFWYQLKCVECGKSFDLQGFKFNEGKGTYCTTFCANSSELRLENVRKSQKLLDKKGEKNPNWKGGLSPFFLYQRHRQSHCAICGVAENVTAPKRKILEVHHIDQDRSNNSIENLTTLCTSCHRHAHAFHKRRARSRDGRFL